MKGKTIRGREKRKNVVEDVLRHHVYYRQSENLTALRLQCPLVLLVKVGREVKLM